MGKYRDLEIIMVFIIHFKINYFSNYKGYLINP